MKKRILLIIFILFLSGCTADYNLTIMKNNKIYEYIIIENNNVNLTPTALSTIKKDYGAFYDIDYNFDPPECDEEGTCDKEEQNIKNNSFSGSKTYESLDDIKSSKALKDFFGEIKITSDNDKYTIIATPKVALKNILEDVNYIKAPISELIININVPYKVTENNANSNNENTYTWIYNNNNTDKELKIVYTTKEENNTNNTENNPNNSANNNSTSNDQNNIISQSTNNGYLIWIIIAVIVAVIALVIINKLKRNDSV